MKITIMILSLLLFAVVFTIIQLYAQDKNPDALSLLTIGLLGGMVMSALTWWVAL